MILRMLLLAAAISLPVPEALAQGRASPEAASGRLEKREVRASRYMAVTAHPLASQAAREVLAEGGSAVDAAIAAQMVLNLVEPQSSGIGGGGFLLHWDAATRALSAWDGRETAPAAATPDRFLRDGRPMRFPMAVAGGLSVGVPGLLRMLEAAHREYGRLPWARLFRPAIGLAREGFAVSHRLALQIASDVKLIPFPASRVYFYDEQGRPLRQGTMLANPMLADTLSRVAEGGADAFYGGAIAEDVARAVREAPLNAGDMTAADIAGYRAKRREPVCIDYRVWRVCGMGPPSSGGIAVAQILKMLEPFDIGGLSPLSADRAHLLAESSRLAFADRNHYVADPDFVDVPVEGLLDAGYLLSRAATISPEISMGIAVPGDPPGRGGPERGPDNAPGQPGTTHMSIVDAAGNVVSMTTTIESQFGSGMMVRGFLLNNELTDFSFAPEHAGLPVANRVGPGKRPRSSMAPTIVFRDGRPVLVIGSPGGSRIIGYVAQATLAILDNGLGPQRAVSQPHVVNRNGPTELEKDSFAERLAPLLGALDHRVRVADMTSGLHAIVIGPDGTLTGGADPRREGVALGE
ncbi:MAG: gamma-glutamyltransferase [Acetobacterales bacterium]